MLLTISYSESAYPITPLEPLKATLYDYFVTSLYFVYFTYIHINDIKFTNDRFKTAKFGFSISDMFSSSFIKILYFLDKLRT